MDSIYMIKTKVTDLYAEQSRWIDMGLRFILGLCVFFYIDNNMEYMEMLNKSYMPILLAVICAVAPLTLMVLITAGLIVAQSYAVSLGLAGMIIGIFLMLFILYFQYTSKQALALMLTPVAFALHIPFAIPIAFGLLGSPFTFIPVSCGILVYYLIDAIKASAEAFSGVSGMDMVGVMITFAKEFALNKELWFMMIVMSLSLVVVSCVRRFAIPYAWKIAMVLGLLMSLLSAAVIANVLEIESLLGTVFLGSIVGVVIGLVLEIFFFAVDYKKTERLTFEDDEYYYHVTAVPKILLLEEEELEEELEEDNEEEGQPVRNEERLRNMQRREEQRRKRQANAKRAEEKISQTMIMSTNKVEQELRRRVNKTRNPQVQLEQSDADKQLLEQEMKKEMESEKN